MATIALATPGVNASSTARVSGTAARRAVLVEINALRHEVHLPAAHLIQSDNGLVIAAARQDRDPALPSPTGVAVAEYGVWGIVSGVPQTAPSLIQIVRSWVFDDGWLGSATVNMDCTGPNAPGCNGHRRAILSPPPMPGSRLTIDIGVTGISAAGQPGISMAALLIWSAPKS